jgi:hypothetical protein
MSSTTSAGNGTNGRNDRPLTDAETQPWCTTWKDIIPKRAICSSVVSYAICQVPGGILTDGFGSARVLTWSALGWVVWVAWMAAPGMGVVTLLAARLLPGVGCRGADIPFVCAGNFALDSGESAAGAPTAR